MLTHVETHSEIYSMDKLMQNGICFFYWGEIIRDTDDLTININVTESIVWG